jgi:glycosyltransferase involved in cell wall biosynthesis
VRCPLDKISCLMVTKDRPEHAARALTCYAAQTHEARELVVVTDGTTAYREQLAALGANVPGFRLVPVAGPLPLGALRNAAVACATGDVLCQWDDDDLYHPERLAVQLEAMVAEGAGASFFTDQLHLYRDDRRVFWDDWGSKKAYHGTPRDTFPWLIPGTIMVRRECGLAYDPALTHHEDTVAKDALTRAGVRPAEVGDRGWLYVYSYHGRNSFNREFHDRIETYLGRAVDRVAPHEAEVRAAFALLPGLPDVLDVCGKDGTVAFTWRREDAP